MSRFFAASDSDSESSSSDEETIQRPVVGTRALAWSSDEDDTKRVVRSEKDKRFDDFKDIIKNIRNHKKIRDMSKMLSAFEDLCRSYDKARKVIEVEGIPKFYIAILVELEDFVNKLWEDRDGRKAMSKNNAKCLTTVRQKLRRYIRDFETQMLAYREKPEDTEEEKSDASDSDNDVGIEGPEDFEKAPAVAAEKKPSRFLKGDDDDDDDDDDFDFDSMTDDDDSSSDDDAKYTGVLTADFFLKKKGDDAEEREKKRKEKEKEKEKRREKDKKRKEEEDAEDEEGWTKVKGGQKVKLFADDAEITHDAVINKLIEIVAGRGKKGTDRSEQIELLLELRKIASANNLGPAIDIKIMFSVVASVFDYSPNIAMCMKGDMWQKAIVNVKELLSILIENSGKIMVGINISDESEIFEVKEGEEGMLRVRGCVLSMVERMDEEFTKMLQACDAHSTEYVERLKDEQAVCDLILVLQGYLEKEPNSSSDDICRSYLKHIEHLYFKFEPKTQGHDAHGGSRATMERLCKHIYEKDNTDRIRARAILCHIYHHAVHDRWFEARDLMLMSHLQDTAQHSDIPTQILYNRAMVQLGLCAFRQNMIKDAHNCLVDIQSSGRAKELLAQGLLLQRQHERTPEQEKTEKRRQMPYHMHINLEMLECVYLVSAMLIEIPYMAAHEFDARRRMISKNFHHVMRVSERQPLVGPPESMREHVVAASKAMKNGDWNGCRNFVINDKMNAKVWDLFYDTKRIQEILVNNIKEESLRTYLFSFSSVYDSLSMQTIADMFELQPSVVHSTISKMIINEELMASLDEPTQCVVMHRTEPSRLQSLALQLSEKVSSLVDFNERMMEARQGGGFFNYQRGGGGRGGGGGNDQQGGYRRDNNQNTNQYGNRGGNRNYGDRRPYNQDGGRRRDDNRRRDDGNKRDNYRRDDGNKRDNYRQNRYH